MNKELPIRVLSIVEGTSVDGPGLRTSIYVAGCNHRCAGCHNPQSWDFNGGTAMSVEEIVKVVVYNGYGVTLSGGDPMCSADVILPLAQEIKRVLPDKDLWIYTGYIYEELADMDNPAIKGLLALADFLVDGPFMESRRKLDLRFKGSDNQRIINLRRTQAEGEIVEWEDTAW